MDDEKSTGLSEPSPITAKQRAAIERLGREFNGFNPGPELTPIEAVLAAADAFLSIQRTMAAYRGADEAKH